LDCFSSSKGNVLLCWPFPAPSDWDILRIKWQVFDAIKYHQKIIKALFSHWLPASHAAASDDAFDLSIRWLGRFAVMSTA